MLKTGYGWEALASGS